MRTIKIGRKKYGLSLVFSLVWMLLLSVDALAQDGKTVFKQNCGMCHYATAQKLVGPGLEGINDRRSEDWLLKWIKDSQGLIKSGDADAQKAFEEGGKSVMPPFSLSDEQIKSILAYIKNPEPDKPVATAQNAETAPVQPEPEPMSGGMKAFLTVLIIVVLAFWYYIVSLKNKIKNMGYDSGNVPLRDRISEWTQQNGTLILVGAIGLIAFVMKTIIQQWM